MLNKLKNLFSKKPEIKTEKTLPKVKKEKELSPKEKATKEGEPYVAVISMELDPNNINSGAFELDFNEIFVARLVKAGYMKKKDDTDNMIVDRWFQNICRHVVMETWEQEQAMQNSGSAYVRTKDIGGGRSEIS